MTPQPTAKNAGRVRKNISLTFDLSARTRPREGLRDANAHCSEQAVDCTVTCVLEDLQLLCHYSLYNNTGLTSLECTTASIRSV